MTGHRVMLNAIIADLQTHHGASAVLPITEHLSRADEALRKMYQAQEADKEFPVDRCRVCGWPLAERLQDGCVKGYCAQRPAPKTRADAGYTAEDFNA